MRDIKSRYQIFLQEMWTAYQNMLFTHKIHEKQAEIYAFDYECLKFLNIIISALATCGIIAAIITSSKIASIIAAVVSFLTTVFTAVLSAFKYDEKAESSKSAANNAIIIREDMRILLRDLCGLSNDPEESDLNNLIDRSKAIYEKRDSFFETAPMYCKRARKKAEKALMDPYIKDKDKILKSIIDKKLQVGP